MPNHPLLVPELLADATSREWLHLSLAQQAVWLDSRLSDSSEYQLGGWMRIPEVLDEEAIGRALALVMARHDALRLRVDDELPRQWLDTSAEPPLTIFDLPAEADPDAAFEAHIDRVFATPMPLGDEPLFQVHLLRAKGLSFILWRFHHLIADSASVAITQQLWINAYETLTSAEPQELAPTSSYLKVLAADSAYVNSTAYDQDLAYWVSRYDPLPPPLIADMEPRRVVERQLPTASYRIAGDELAALHAAAELAGTSAHRTLFALFIVALARRHGQWDIISGIALHRRDAASRFTVGMLAGMIGVRCQFEGYWTLEEAVQAFSEQFDTDLRHQKMPLDIVARNLDLASRGRSGLSEVAISYIPGANSQEATSDKSDSHGITGGAVSTREASPISFHLADGEDGFDLEIAVNATYLDAAEASSMLDLLRVTLATFCKAPRTRLEELPTLTPGERALVVDSWNDTTQPFPVGTLEALFAAQVQATPGAIAVLSAEGAALTYRELDARSTTLARQLVAAGIKPGQAVGVKMPRSTETIIALLAILKAGAIYLPLDPAYPADRLSFMIEDAGAALVLESIDTLTLEADLPAAATLADPNRRAYIIYTSGTTGKPKGVVVPHKAAVNLAYARRAAHDPIQPGDRILAAISVGFDVSIGQIILPLLSGCTVVIAPELKLLSASEFWALLARHRITHINSVPSFFDSVLDAAPSIETLSLKRLMLGGEALTGALVARLRRDLPGVEVVNIYGPTEACIDATYYITKPEDAEKSTLPIGRPLPNYQAYVLNTELEPTGMNVTGEIYLGGAGIAECYLNAPDLTAARFISSPFAPDARLYRTGDRARWTAAGEIEFLGRVDEQVKIRGFRVEPAEIAAVLLQLPAVAQAVVVPIPGPTGLRLVAYIVPASGEAFDAAILRAHAAANLPHYMVPSTFFALKALPLTHNGKLDLKALPKPENASSVFIAPRTPTETAVAAAFADVLGLERCGATDNFFELGGHSLLAASLTSRLRSLGVKLPLRVVFEAPMVEALARHIDLSLHDTGAAETILPQPRGAACPLSFSQERLWFLDRLQQDATYNIPIAVELRGPLHLTALEKALRLIVDRHEILRTRILVRDGQPMQEVVASAPEFLSHVDLSTRSETALTSTLTAEINTLAKTPLDLAAGSPLRVRILTLAQDRYVVAAVFHHAAFDGWSANLFLQELLHLYSAFTAGNSNPLPPLSLQYADFALWQRSQKSSQSLAFWIEELQDAPALSQLQPTLPSSSDAHRPAAELRLPIKADLYAALVLLARRHNVSLFMVLHAALALHLARTLAQDDIVLGTVVANRDHTEIESLIGCFVNTLPLRTRFLPGETFAALLERVKNTDLSAFAHQDHPFEQLVERLAPRRSLETTPIFQHLLVLQNTPQPAVSLPDLTLTPIPVEMQSAQFDLTLNLVESGDQLTGTLEYAANRYDRATIQHFADGFVNLLTAVAADPEISTDIRAAAPLAAPLATPLPVAEPAPTPIFVAPLGETEQTLAALWADLLQLERISRHDNFFELGGHSLLTITLIERLAQRGFSVDIRAIFTHPTLAGLAAQLTPLGQESQTLSGPIPLGTTAVTPELLPLAGLSQAQIDRLLCDLPGGAPNLQDVYPLAPLQEGILFQHLLAPTADPYIAPFLLGFDTEQRLEGFLKALDQVVSRHDALRTAMHWSNVDRPLQVVVRKAAVPVHEVTLDPQKEAQAQLLDRLRSNEFSLPLDKAPMMRAIRAYDVSSERWLLLLLTHHLVLDHASMEIVVAEIHALMQDSAAVLPEPGSYRSYVTRTLADQSAHKAFFQDLLGEVSEPTAPHGQLTLPEGHTPADLREASLTLDAALTLRIRTQAASLGVTPASLFHLAWANVLGHAAGRRDVVFGTILLGRAHGGPSASRSVGMLINTLPVYVRLGDASALNSALAVHGLLAELLEHEHASLAQAQRCSGVTAPTPLFSSLFNYRHSPNAPNANFWPGVEMLFAEERTNYPLAMAVDDTGEIFRLTTIAAKTLDPKRFCEDLKQAIEALVLQLHQSPDAPLPNLPPGPPRIASPTNVVALAATAEYQEPRTLAERTLQSIWQRVLGLPRIGIHDDFFQIGGDSLSAMRLISAASSVLNCELPMRVLLSAPTIAQMASSLMSPAGESDGLIRLQPNGDLPPLYCIHPAGGYVFCYLPLARALGLNQPVFGLQAAGLEDDQPLPASIEEAAASHIRALQQHQPEGPYQLLGLSSGGLIAFEMARQLRASGATVSLLAMLDTAVPQPSVQQAIAPETLLRAMAVELGCFDLLERSPAPASLAELVGCALDSGRLPAGFTYAHAERIARVFANIAQIHNRYQPIATTEPVLLIRATRRVHELDALPDWSPYIPATSHVTDLDCGHIDLVSELWVPSVVNILKENTSVALP